MSSNRVDGQAGATLFLCRSFVPWFDRGIDAMMAFSFLNLPDHHLSHAVSPASMNGAQMFSKQTYVYKVVGNCEIQADVFRPPDHAARPAVCFCMEGHSSLEIDNPYLQTRWQGSLRQVMRSLKTYRMHISGCV